MPSRKKLAHGTARLATSEGFWNLGLVASALAGIVAGFSHGMPNSDKAPIEDAAAAVQVESTLNTLTTAFTARTEKFDFDSRTLKSLQANIGRNAEQVDVALKTLETERARLLTETSEIQQDRYRIQQTVMLTPYLSEKAVSEKVEYGLISVDYSYRDECLADLNIAPISSGDASISQEILDSHASCTLSKNDAQIGAGFLDFFSTSGKGVLFLGAFAFAASGWRRSEDMLEKHNKKKKYKQSVSGIKDALTPNKKGL